MGYRCEEGVIVVVQKTEVCLGGVLFKGGYLKVSI